MYLRKPTALILLLVITLLLTACGTQQTTTSTPQPQQNYVGSINSDKYHYPDCEWAQKIKPENEVWFSSPEEARKAGYKPCKVCSPPR
jgi:outer membrane biogenesis lipoprotein LolB